MTTELKVSSRSNPNSVAGALVASLRESEKIKILAVGAGAVNQAVKAVAISRGFVAPLGKDLIMQPAFFDTEINDEERTGITLVVTMKN